MRHGVPVVHLESEEEYFHRQDAELIVEMRKRAAAEEEHRRMAEASHIEDPKILDALEKLGYTHTTLVLLHLVPLVELAWIDGSVSATARSRIFALAGKRGVRDDTPAYRQLVAWLDQRPSQGFFEGSWAAIEAAIESLPANERRARQEGLGQICREFASASCARFGRTSWICAAKRGMLHKIARRLKLPHEQNPPGGLSGSARAA